MKNYFLILLTLLIFQACTSTLNQNQKFNLNDLKKEYIDNCKIKKGPKLGSHNATYYSLNTISIKCKEDAKKYFILEQKIFDETQINQMFKICKTKKNRDFNKCLLSYQQKYFSKRLGIFIEQRY